jgi:hypothetical protein
MHKFDPRTLLDGRFYDAELRAKFSEEHPVEFAEVEALAWKLTALLPCC